MIRATLLSFLLAHCLAATIPLQDERIIGGDFADQGEYPFQVSLSYLTEFVYFGAAVILNENYILTAAHCVDGIPLTDLYIRVGDVNITAGERHELVRVIVHEKFNFSDSLINDIAIVEVSPPFTFGPNIQPIKLPNQGDEPLVGAKATAIGWGQTAINGTGSEILKEVEVEIIDQDICRSANSVVGLNVYPGHICVGITEGHSGVCRGDSGGPILIDGIVVGISSWAYECASTVYPSGFTRVAYYRDWITQKTGV